MKRLTRLAALLVAVLVTVSFIFAGCSSTEKSSGNSPAKESTKETAKTNTEPVVKKPVKFKMFFGNAGIKFPEDIDPGNNDFVKVFEDAANVDVEMIMPAYQEFQTKFNLMMSSGEIPDLVHCWFKNDVDRYGMEGAFKNWKDVLPKSTTLKTYYPEDAIKLMETTNGGVYGLNVLANGTVDGTGIRIDLVNEVNGGKMPITPDEWYQFFKNIKAKYPDAVPIAPNSGKSFYRATNLFYAFGVHPWGLQTKTIDSTEYFWALEHENIKKAVEFYKKLYDEGLLYREFATIVGDTHSNLVNTKKLAYYDTDEGNITAIQQGMAKAGDNTGAEPDRSAIWVFAPTPLEPGVDIREANQRRFYPIGWHCVAINAKANEETTMGIVRFIEALADKKLLETCVWGREGIEYSVSNNERVVNTDAHLATVWRLAYQFFRTYYYAESMEFRRVAARTPLTDDQKAVYDKAYAEGIKSLQNDFKRNPQVAPVDFVKLPDLAPKYQEAQDKAHEIIYKAIMGEISMNDFDNEVKDFVKKYKEVKDAYNNEIKKFAK